MDVQRFYTHEMGNTIAFCIDWGGINMITNDKDIAALLKEKLFPQNMR